MSRKVDLDYTNFETLGEIKNKYPDSTLVMRKRFVDIAIEHERNHGRPVGEQLGVCVDLSPMCNAGDISKDVANRLITSLVPELEKLITKHAQELGELYVRVSFYKEPKL